MPAGTSIYIDILFMINFMMDYLLLWGAARLAQISRTRWRLAVGACLGAVYSILVLLPDFDFLTSVLLKFLLPILMLAVAFIPMEPARFGRAVLYFYLLFINMIGVALLIFYLTTNGLMIEASSNQPLSFAWLVVPLADAILLGKWGMPFLRRAFMQELQKMPMVIRLQGKEFKVNGMADTGNQLFDPLTRAPVIIVEYGVLGKLLPQKVKLLLQASGDLDVSQLAECFTVDGKPLHLRLIPFTTIGKQHGMLVGLRPDEVIIMDGDQKVRKTNVIIGLYSRQLSPQGHYRALLHPDLLNSSIGA